MIAPMRYALGDAPGLLSSEDLRRPTPGRVTRIVLTVPVWAFSRSGTSRLLSGEAAHTAWFAAHVAPAIPPGATPPIITIRPITKIATRA